MRDDDARPGTPATAGAAAVHVGDGAHGTPSLDATGARADDDADAARSRRRRTTVIVAAVCLVLVLVMTIIAAVLVGPRRPAEYGDWLPLDRLWDECAAGDGAACDELFVESPMRSDYERFGSSCGDRFPGATLSCVDLMTNRPDERQQ
ncbi:hypothetical protein [Georgenia sp. Z1491]|uniref:hypothetical protein n=1 Tax=Georgenia sp. Z1491 TaxID=3416707 RepID=UPI003CF1D6A8